MRRIAAAAVVVMLAAGLASLAALASARHEPPRIIRDVGPVTGTVSDCGGLIIQSEGRQWMSAFSNSPMPWSVGDTVHGELFETDEKPAFGSMTLRTFRGDDGHETKLVTGIAISCK